MKAIYVALLASLIAVPTGANSQGLSGLADLLGSVNRVIQTVGGAVSSGSDAAITPQEIVDTLARDTHPMTGDPRMDNIDPRCVDTATPDTRVNIFYRGSDLKEVAMISRTGAVNMAACSKRRNNLASRGEFTSIGRLLAVSALVTKRAELDTESTSRDAKFARTLLSLDRDNYKEHIFELDQSFKLGDAPSTIEPTQRLTAEAFAREFDENSFAFRQKYEGKRIEISGPVLYISGGQGSASVGIQGIRRPKDEGRIQDNVGCRGESSDFLKAATTIKKSQNVVVSGIYRQNQFDPFVNLEKCEFLGNGKQ